MGIFGKTDAGGRDSQRRDEYCFPQEEEREKVTPGAWVKGLAEINIRSTGSRHCRAQFGVNHPIADGKYRAQKPPEDCLRSAHRGKDYTDGDEGANADHPQHVHSDGLKQAHAANKFFGGSCDLGGKMGRNVFGQSRRPGKKRFEYRGWTIAAGPDAGKPRREFTETFWHELRLATLGKR